MAKVAIVGILNTTPDSYFDGGHYTDIGKAVLRAGQLLQEGADYIEVGGESSGPKSQDVSLEEELQRVIPVVEAIRETYPHARIAVDTYKAAVAKQAIERNVSLINDVTAGRGDPEMFTVVAASGASLVLMYSKDPTARTTIDEREYDDVIATVKTFLQARKEAAITAGVRAEKILVDPGLGHFVSADSKYSFELLAHLEEFASIAPVYISPSRKSFLAGQENLGVGDRLPGTIAASAIAVLHGAKFIRTHDVAQIRRGCEIAEAVLEAGQ